MIFGINFIISLLGFIYYTKRTFDRNLLLSPHMIIWGMPILLLFYPALLNQPFYIDNLSFNLIITAGLLGSFIGCFFVKIPNLARQHDEASGEWGKVKVPDDLLRIGAGVYLAYLLFHIIKPVIISKSVIGALSVSRLDQYLSGGILKGSGIELFFLFPEIIYYIFIGLAFNKRKYFKAILLCIVLSLYYIFNANTRLPMIMPLASFIIVYLSRLSRKMLLWLMPIILISGIIFVFAFSVLGNAIRWGQLTSVADLMEGVSMSFKAQNRSELGYFDWLYHFYDAIQLGQVQFDNGAAWCYYGPISIFPRALWPNKPITSTSNRLTESVYNSQIGTGIPITTFTIYGEGFWQAGYFGAFLAPILFMAIYGILINNIQYFANTDFWVAMLICQMATFFRGELPIPQFITTLIFIILLWWLSRRWELFGKILSPFIKRIFNR